MASASLTRKEERFNATGAELSASAYNLAMGLVVLYGLLVNALACYFISDTAIVIISQHPIIFLLVYLGLVIFGSLLAGKSDNPFISFIGYNLIVLPLGIIVSATVGLSSTALVIDAIKLTAGVVLVMIGLSCAFPRFFMSLGKALFISLIALIVVELICMIARLPLGWTSYAAAAIFSLYIGYDIQKAQRYPKTLDNAVDCAIDIYMDVIYLFLNLLDILDNN